MDMYNTVWLSDYESIRSYGSRSGFSSLSHSKIDSLVDNVYHSSPKMYAKDMFRQNGMCRSCLSRKPSFKNYMHRTHSLPDLDFANLKPSNLQDRFSHLQLEQENKELRLLVDQLQDTLETVEETMKLDFRMGLGRRPSHRSFIRSFSNGFKHSQELFDSLDGSIDSYKSNSKHMKSRDKNESGYCTSRHDSYANVTNKDIDDDLSRYSEYSESDGSTFYESRLVKKRGDANNESSCCLVS